jgi:hypothetical protein
LIKPFTTVERDREPPTLQLFDKVSLAMRMELERETEALGRFISSLGGDR